MNSTSNIVRLPTAAPRKVKQGGVRAVRAARDKASWPWDWRPPHIRQREAEEVSLRKLERSPELFAVLAMLCVLPPSYSDGLEAVAKLLRGRDPDGEASALGEAIVMEAVRTRRNIEILAKTEGR
jgi:hypothetical protein